MIDLESECLLTLREACRLSCLQRNGRNPHISQMYRWSNAGLRGVQLETVQIGGTRCTSKEAVLRFILRLTGAPAANVSSTARAASIRRAERELDQAGI